MATIRVGYKRTFQTRSYETQVIEMSVEDEGVQEKGARITAKMAAMYGELEAVGDELMAKALARPDPAGRK